MGVRRPNIRGAVLELKEYYNLFSELRALIRSLPPEQFYKNLSVVGIDNDRITKLIEYIKENKFRDGELIDVYLFLLKHILPDDYERLFVRERIGSSSELYEFDPVKNGYSLKDIQIPFSELEQSFHLYMLGYHITDYIVSDWGLTSVRQLIEARGNTQKVLNLSVKELEKGFWRYMDCKYYEKSCCR